LSDDGFDAALCRVDQQKGTVSYAGARIGCFLMPRTHDPVIRVNGTKTALGYRGDTPHVPLPEMELAINDVAMLVVATDGLFDQPGGPNGRAFGPARMADAISSHRGSSAAVVADQLHGDFLNWMGTQNRRDDVCALVLGF
jgi:serine phosphatase RsbU (regulator of sigma subunit)